jgi:hypothetical protein
MTITGEVTDFWTDYLHFPDGGRLGITNPDPKHLHIYAAKPTGINTRFYPDAPGIKVSVSRPEMDIARDIIRRLLPAARAYWQLCRDEAAKHADTQARIKQTTDILAPRFNVRFNDDQTHAHIGNAYASGEVYSDGFINDFLIRSLTTAQAIKIIEMLEAQQ